MLNVLTPNLTSLLSTTLPSFNNDNLNVYKYGSSIPSHKWTFSIAKSNDNSLVLNVLTTFFAPSNNSTFNSTFSFSLTYASTCTSAFVPLTVGVTATPGPP